MTIVDKMVGILTSYFAHPPETPDSRLLKYAALLIMECLNDSQSFKYYTVEQLSEVYELSCYFLLSYYPQLHVADE